MNFNKLITTIITTIIFGGCGTNLGFLRDSTTAQRFNYSLDLKEVSMQRTVSASTEAKTLICLIPTDGDPPYATAMERLHAEAKLGPNEVLVNIREDKRILTYLIYCKHRLTISADVYRLGRAKSKPPSKGLQEPDWSRSAATRPAKSDSGDQDKGAKPRSEKKAHPCTEKYWTCMEYCGTRGCGKRCVREQQKCYRGRSK